MILQDFLKDLFNQPAVEGYEIGRLEVDVSINKIGNEPIDIVVGGEKPCAKIVIVLKEKVIDKKSEGP